MPSSDSKGTSSKGESGGSRSRRISAAAAAAVEDKATTDAINKGIDHMYKIYDKLNSAADKTTLEGEFRELLEAVKRSEKEKRLASQFITRFLEFFPLLYTEAIDALLDLAEDDDLSIRKQVCRDLITVCKKVSTFVPKIADVFSQLMLSEDTGEYVALQSCLVSLFHIDAQAALVGIFSQIVNGPDVVKERCFKFLTQKLKDLSPEIVNLEFEKCMVTETKRVFNELTSEDFKQLYEVLLATKLLKTISGQQMLVDLLGDMLELEKEFDASEVENFDRLLSCSKYVLQLLSPQVTATQFFYYYCTKVLPNLGDAVMVEDGGKLKLEALRMMADMAHFTGTLDASRAEKCMDIVYSNVLELLPLPPEEEDPSPKFEFSHIECYLYALHKLGGECPDFFNGDPDKLKDFRNRLQYLARATQAYMRKLREDLQGKKGTELRTDDNRSKIQALKLTTNISAVIKDLFHTPPSYRSTIGLSWRPINRLVSTTKRRSMSTSSDPLPLKHSRNENRAIYQPPSGKFSSRAGSYSGTSSGRGGRGSYGGRGRDTYRGRSSRGRRGRGGY